MRIFESLLWTQAEGYFLLPFHLERMESSAAALSYAFSRSAAVKTLDGLHNELDSLSQFIGGSRKVRLFLEKDGTLSTDHEDTALREPKGILKLAVAADTIDPDDALIRHKITGRVLYKNAAPVTECDYDDLLFFNVLGEACETTRANIAVKIDGTWYTPPVSCGLLPGTFRRYLLKNGELTERVLLRGDILAASEIALLNSVRKWMPARLVTTSGLA